MYNWVTMSPMMILITVIPNPLERMNGDYIYASVVADHATCLPLMPGFILSIHRHEFKIEGKITLITRSVYARHHTS